MIYVLLILLFLLASVLLLPIGIELDYSERGRRWAIVWLGMRIRVPSPFKRTLDLLKDDVEAREPASPQRDQTLTEEFEAEERFTVPTLDEVLHAMSTGLRAFEHGVDLIRSLSRHLRVRVHRLDVQVASPNPALTGFSYGMLCAFGSAYPMAIPWTVGVDFTETRPAVSFRVSVKITLIKIIPAIYRFVRFMTRRQIGRLRHRLGNESRA